MGQAIVRGLEKTPGLRRLLAAKRAYDRLKAQAIGGLVTGAKWVGPPVLKGARIVDRAIRTADLLRKYEIGTSELPDVARERLGTIVQRGGRRRHGSRRPALEPCTAGRC